MILAMSSMLRTETQNSVNDKNQEKAKLNALLGLGIALSELQKTMGPDQRVSAKADLLDGSGDSGIHAASQKSHWTGVWNTSNYNPELPEKKEFLGWLVSNKGSDDKQDRLMNLKDADSTQNKEDSILLISNPDSGKIDEYQFEVEKIPVKDREGNQIGAYAWGVIDEGIKAKVSIPNSFDNYNKDENSSYKKALVDDLLFSFPHRNPIEILPELKEIYESNISRIDSLLSPNSIDFITENKQDQGKYFHDLSVSSRLLFTDTKNGGLKVDLSRALDSDFKDSLQNKYVFQETISDPNAGVTKTIQSVKWDVLADYYNHYKKIEYPSNSYKPEISPDSTVKDSNGNMRKFLPEKEFTHVSTLEGSLLDKDGNRFDPGFHPIAPVVTQVLFRIRLNAMSNWSGSIQGSSSDNFHHLNFEIVPQFVLWNPYNVKLSASNYRIHFDPGFSYTVEYSKPEWAPSQIFNFKGMTHSGAPTYTNAEVVPKNNNSERADFYAFLKENNNLNGFRSLAHYITNVSLEPGEVKSFGLLNIDTTGSTRIHSCQTGWNYGLNNLQTFSRVFLFPNDYSNGNIATNNVADDFGVRGISMIPNSFVSNSGNNMFDGGRPWAEKIRIHGFSLYSSDFPESEDPVAFRMGGRFYLSILDSNDTLSLENNATFLIHDSDTEPEATLGSLVRLGSSFRYNESEGQNFYYPRRADYSMGGITESWEWANNKTYFPLNIFMNLKTTDGLNGDLPIYGQFNPMAWHFTPSTNSGHSDLWHSDFKTDTDWNDIAAWHSPASLTGNPKWGNEIDTPGTDILVAKQVPIQPLRSVGDFMHSEIGIFDSAPLYTVGNSYAPPFSNGSSANNARMSRIYTAGSDSDRFNNEVNTADWSWLYNDALFDKYFFSTIPNKGNTAYPPFKEVRHEDIESDQIVLPNSRFEFFKSSNDSESDYMENLNHSEQVASRMFVNGGFNINSTSQTAWKILLSSINKNSKIDKIKDKKYYNASNGNLNLLNNSSPKIPRFGNPMGPEIQSVSNTNDPSSWNGFRTFTSSEINQLADEIVSQIKRRGPFQSISDFVNRRLEANALGSSGALQSAMDSVVNNVSNMGNNTNLTKLWNSNSNSQNLLPKTGIGNNSWLLQNDLLRIISPVISARSDTFTIRSYGESKDSTSGEIKSHIICEAVVQRIPEYMDSSNRPYDINLSAINKTMGRKFQIVSVRWLSSSEI